MPIVRNPAVRAEVRPQRESSIATAAAGPTPSFCTASRYGSAAGLLRATLSAPTMTWKAAVSPAGSRIAVISAPSDPEAIAERVARAEPRDGAGRCGKQERALRALPLEPVHFPIHDLPDFRPRHRQPRVVHIGDDEVVVVVAEVPVEVGVAIERPAAIAEDRLERAQVQRFGIGEDAVEIEHDGLHHLPSRSPAWIATGSRFSAGGTGQM